MNRTLKYLFFACKRLNLLALLGSVILIFSVQVCPAQDNEDSDGAVAIFNQAQDLQEKGSLLEAIKLYEKALALLPKFPEAEYQRGVALLTLGKTDGAEKGFRRAVELRPDWSLALSSLGSALVLKAKYSEAENVLTKALDLDTQNFPALLAMTELRLKTKAPVPVLNTLLSKITEFSTKTNPPVSIWVARAALQSSVGLTPDARVSIDKALSIAPQNKFALAQSAEIALDEGDYVRAVADAALLEKVSPDAEAVVLVRARVLAHDGKIDEAVKLLDLNSTPSSEAAALRTNLIASGSTNPADLEKQIAADPKSVLLLGQLCNVYRKDDPVKALDFCRRASEAEPGNVSHAVGFAAALVQAKQFDSAVALLKKIVEIVPDNWTAHANLATALFQLKRYVEAKVEFEWLTAKQPRVAAAYYFLAIAHDQLTEYMDAMANYQQYLRLADPVQNKLDIEKVNLRLPLLKRLIKQGKGKKNQ